MSFRSLRWLEVSLERVSWRCGGYWLAVELSLEKAWENSSGSVVKDSSRESAPTIWEDGIVSWSKKECS